jgi:hypothetical protein
MVTNSVIANVWDLVCNYTELEHVVDIVLNDVIDTDESVYCEEDMIVSALDLLSDNYSDVRDIPVSEVEEVRNAFELALHSL